MQLLVENETNFLILDGDIQGTQVAELDDALNSLKDKKAGRVAIDMSKVGYIYSRGIGVLVRAQKDLQANGGGLYLFNLKNSVQKILMEINLIDYLNGFATKEEMEFEFFRSDPSKDEASLELGLHIESFESKDDSVTFNLTGTIDSVTDIEALNSECLKKIDEGCKIIKFNLADLIYIDDDGVNEWKILRDNLVAKSGSLTLISINEIILDQLQILGVQDQFIIES